MRNPLAVCFVSVTCAGLAQAGESRLAVDLDWHHVPRGGEAVKQEAKLPGGALIYQAWNDGTVGMTVHLDGGQRCQTMAGKGEVLFLTCGRAEGYYSIMKVPDKQTSADWVMDGSSAAGDKS